MASAPALDMGKLQSFAFKVVGDVTAQQMGPLSTIGDRLGLFRTLATAGPMTSAAFAERAQIDERYGREWLAAMACHGYLAYDDATEAVHPAAGARDGARQHREPLLPHRPDRDVAALLGEHRPLGRGVQARRRRAAGALRRALLVRLRAVHLHLLPQQHGAGVVPGHAPGGRRPARRRLRRRCRLRQRAGADHPRAGVPGGDLRRLRQLRPGDRGGERTRAGGRAWRIGCASRSAT